MVVLEVSCGRHLYVFNAFSHCGALCLAFYSFIFLKIPNDITVKYLRPSHVLKKSSRLALLSTVKWGEQLMSFSGVAGKGVKHPSYL